jgi:hypothetical protein
MRGATREAAATAVTRAAEIPLKGQKISDGFSGASQINGLSVAEDMPETHAQNQSRGGGFGARRVCLRRDARTSSAVNIAAIGRRHLDTQPHNLCNYGC